MRILSYFDTSEGHSILFRHFKRIGNAGWNRGGPSREIRGRDSSALDQSLPVSTCCLDRPRVVSSSLYLSLPVVSTGLEWSRAVGHSLPPKMILIVLLRYWQCSVSASVGIWQNTAASTIIIIPGQFIKRRKWWFGPPHQGRFYILAMMAESAVGSTRLTSATLYLHVQAAINYTPITVLGIITPDLSPVPICRHRKDG